MFFTEDTLPSCSPSEMLVKFWSGFSVRWSGFPALPFLIFPNIYSKMLGDLHLNYKLLVIVQTFNLKLLHLEHNPLYLQRIPGQ